MADPRSHAHSDSPDHGHDHTHAPADGAARRHGHAAPARPAVEPRSSWLLHSVAQRLLGAALVCAALVAAMLWATSTQG